MATLTGKNKVNFVVVGSTENFGKIKSGMKGVGETAKTTAQKMQAQWISAAKAMGAAFATFVTARALKSFVDASLTEFVKYQRGIVEVSTLSEEVSANLDKFGKDLLQVGEDTGQGLDVLQKGLFDVVSAGIPAGESIEFLGIAGRLAVAGVTNISVSVDGLTSIINAYGLEASKAEMVADKFFTAQKFGKTTVEELAGSIGKIAPITSAAGISMDEMFAALSRVTLSGVSSEEATTALVTTIKNLIDPQESAAKAAREMGFELGATAVRTEGLTGIFQKIADAEGMNIEKAQELGITMRGLKAILSITGDGLEKYNVILEGMNHSSGASEKAFKKMSDTLGFAVDVLEAVFASFFVRSGENMEELGRKSVEVLQFSLIPLLENSIETFIDFNNVLKRGQLDLGSWIDAMGGAMDLMSAFIGKNATKIEKLGDAFLSARQEVRDIEKSLKVLDKTSFEYAQTQSRLFGALIKSSSAQNEYKRAIEASTKTNKKNADSQMADMRQVQKRQDSHVKLFLRNEKLKKDKALFAAEEIAKKAAAGINAQMNFEKKAFERHKKNREKQLKADGKALDDFMQLQVDQFRSIEKIESQLKIDIERDTLSATDFKINELDRELAKHDEVVTNKDLLNKWYLSQLEIINEEQENDMSHLAEFNVGTLQRMLDDDLVNAEQRASIWRELQNRIRDGQTGTIESFQLGWSQALDSWEFTTESMFKLGESLADNMKDQFADVFVDALNGQLKSGEEIIEVFAEATKRIIFQMLAEIAAKKIVLRIAGGLTDMIGPNVVSGAIGGAAGAGVGASIAAPAVVGGAAAGATLPTSTLGSTIPSTLPAAAAPGIGVWGIAAGVATAAIAMHNFRQQTDTPEERRDIGNAFQHAIDQTDFSRTDVGRAFSGIGTPRFEHGIDLVPKNMLAFIHKGERVQRANENPFNQNNGRSKGVSNGNTVNITIQGNVIDNEGFVDSLISTIDDKLHDLQLRQFE